MIEPTADEDVAAGGLASDEDEDAKTRRQAELDAYAAALDQFSLGLTASRTEAINARTQSGCEEQWLEDEEFYEGIDDLNRGEFAAWRTKPPGQENPAENETKTASTVFPNITRPYVDAASARVSDMLLPTDDRSYSFGPTPVPELVDVSKGKLPRAVLNGLAQQYPGKPRAAADAAEQMVRQAMAVMEDAREKADRALKVVEDWHIECQYHAEVREVIEDAAKIGTGVLKGPIPMKRRVTAFKDGALHIAEEIKPISKRISSWNLYPDPACGENIHNGSHIWECDDISERQLERLKGAPGYIDFQIDRCLEEGPSPANSEVTRKPEPDGRQRDNRKLFKIWYYHGNLGREQLELCGCKVEEGEERVTIPAQVTMVNSRVIKAVLNPLDTGEFPYDVMPWQKKSGTWTGIGVARQIRTPQRMVVGASRNMMDNAGRAGGPQLVIQQGAVVPHDGFYEVTPWKVWLAGADKDLEHLDKAFRFVTIPMLQKDLMAIIQFGLKLAEDVTGLPLILQGQQGKAPDTLGGMQMLNNNASTVLRRLARLFDDRITEPHIRRYYAFLLMYGPDDAKGDFQIDARGSTALVERDLQNQAILTMGKMVLDPRFGKDPKKWMDEWLKSQRLDPKRFDFDEERWEQIIANMAKGPQDPRLAVAQLRAESEDRERKFQAQLTAVEQQFEERENARDRELDLYLAEMEQNGQQSVSITDLKARLADTTIRVRAQRAMAAEDRQHDARQAMRPAVEPRGRARPGQAFQQ